jgi:hypothetical protein
MAALEDLRRYSRKSTCILPPLPFHERFPAVVAHEFVRHRQAAVDEVMLELQVRARSLSSQAFRDEDQRKFG